MKNYDLNRRVGYESSKAYAARCQHGFWGCFVRGPAIVDVGYRGGTPNALPILDGALGVEFGDPGYDGLHLPVPNESQDAVHASHILEHVSPAEAYLSEWFSKLKVGGFLLLFVPSAYLYERSLRVPPSRWSGEHLRAYTPASLMQEVATALPNNAWRLRHLADNDMGYDYSLPKDAHPTGCLEIECVIQRIAPPEWDLDR